MIGQAAEFSVEDVVESVHRGRTVRRAISDYEEDLERIREATLIKRALFGSLHGFSRDAYENVQCRFDETHLLRFIEGMAKELTGWSWRQGDDEPGTWHLKVSPAASATAPGLAADYPRVTCDRSMLKVRPDLELLGFSHPAFDMLIEAACSDSFGGRVGRRSIRAIHDDLPLGEFFQFNFAVTHRHAEERAVEEREFVPVLVSPDLQIVTAKWTWEIIYAQSDGGRSVRWSPDRLLRQAALEKARAFVDARELTGGDERQRQPAVLTGAAIVEVRQPAN